MINLKNKKILITGAHGFLGKNIVEQLLNIGCGEEITIKKLVELVTQIIGFTGLIKWDETKPDGQPRRKLDTEKARKEFGFIAKTPFEKGLIAEIDWYKQQYLK